MVCNIHNLIVRAKHLGNSNNNLDSYHKFSFDPKAYKIDYLKQTH